MSTITGTLVTILGTSPIAGSIEVALCGYGSQVPRINGSALFAQIVDKDVTVESDGTFTFEVSGNDLITPEGTYYTVTVKDENGDIAQVNAYQFASGVSDYDLNQIDPYDPNQPPSPLPPPITDLLLVIEASDDMVFDLAQYTAFKTTLTLDVTHPGFANPIPGNLYTFLIVQDATGGWEFIWPANVFNAALVDPSPLSTTIQTFVVDEMYNLYAIAPGTYYP